MDEKTRPEQTEKEAVSPTNSHDGKRDVAFIKTTDGDQAYTEAALKEPVKFTGRTLYLFLACMVGFFCSTANGYDGSLLNALLSNEDFKNNFNIENKGIWTGIVTSMYQIGSVVALPFVGPIIDNFGRRGGMFSGALFIILGTIVSSTTAHNANVDQFMGGRFLLGFGVSLATTAGPMFVTEITHPKFRGIVTALYNTFYFTGSILAAGAARGSLSLSGNRSWLVPSWLQMLFSGIIALFVWFLPESPRWLYVHGNQEKCMKTLVYWHGNGNPDSVWVQLQVREYGEHLKLDGADKRWWDYRALFRDRASRYRLGCNLVISVFGQWAGNAVLSYFLSAVLESAGVKDETQQLNINLGYSCLQFVVAMTGAACVDRFGRRFLLLFANIGCCIVWIGMTVATSQYDATESAASAKASIVMIFLFGVCFSFGFTPLQALYPVEVLSFEMRAKGMAFSSFTMNCAMLLNQFAWPVALKEIGWKTYIIFTIWCAVQATVIYFFIPETRNRTLEELDDIFAAPNPRKASTEKKKVALDSNANVVDVQEA